MVVTCWPATEEIGVMQERVAWPSMCTVQAPHCADAAAEFGAVQADDLADRPEQGHVGIGVERGGFAVEREGD